MALACLALLWGVSWICDRDFYYYFLSLVGAAASALKWQRIYDALMLRWLKAKLWIPLAALLCGAVRGPMRQRCATARRRGGTGDLPPVRGGA